MVSYPVNYHKSSLMVHIGVIRGIINTMMVFILHLVCNHITNSTVNHEVDSLCILLLPH
jgi:hypothetical protein